MLNTRHLDTLCRIASTGSFQRSADELNIPLSTLSMQMKALENQLNVELFDRRQRPPALTPLGRRIAESAREVLAAEASLLSVSSETAELSGNWRIGMVATASVRLLPGFLKLAAKSAPAARFQIETALSEVLEARVLAGQIDAAIVSASEKPQKGLSYLVLREEPLVFAIPRDSARTTPEYLARALSFLQFNPGSGIGKQIELYMHQHFPEPHNTIVLDSVESIMECVNESLGFTLLSEADALRYGDKSLRFIYPETGQPTRKLALAWSERSQMTEQVMKLGAMLV